MSERIEIPASKSYANRALILSSVKKDPVTIHNIPAATDVTKLLENLLLLGLKITRVEGGCTIHNSFPECESVGMALDVGEGGTTARFLASLLLRGSRRYELVLGERLKQRPWSEFIEQMNGLGAKVSLSGNTLSVQGPLKPGEEIRVDCSRTTQFASGLLMAFAESDLRIHPINLRSSLSYWSMTSQMVKDILGSVDYTIPRDWSSASYPLAFGAINQEIIFPGLMYDEAQADAKFFKLLNSLGSAMAGEDYIKVRPVTLNQNISFDVSDCLDLVPALSFFLAHIPGSHSLLGTDNLKHKESDRQTEIIGLLKIFKRKAYAIEGSLVIEGHRDIVNEALDLVMPDDHRMVMAASLFLRHHSGGSIMPAEAVHKSYPEFYSIFS